ncbi:HsdR family type I site-specific deoxyribonuclease [Rothia dentocariosa]|uniref:HsdR family type I site-specific deoxyribonuclease n=1 Tax=Rothia dentocariosa TaxID=2047 RepID=UPI0028802DC3|nr:HsdR family type I site-specific deoxyribonuclease [Rothia dentocariosa]
METVPHYPVPTNPTDTLIVNADYATVIAEYDEPREKNGAHQSEAQLEKRLIEVLISQGYEYLPIHTEEDLLTNLRTQIELLNTRDNEPLALSDDEWKRLLTYHIAKPSEGRAEKTHRIQKEPRIAFERDNGTTRNITLLDRRSPNNNRVQVINQYSVQGSDGTHPLMNRYDVTILVNGLPMVHIELKKRGVSIKEAFQQIDRYQKESFWAGLGLYEYVQLFVISNGSQTKYYSNTVRNAQVAKYGNAQERNIKAGTESFEFTSYWADAQNHRITDLIPFARTFLAKRTILNIITRYCVLNTEGTLLVMRPYQIVATESIINRVLIANNDRRRIGTRQGGGFIWHTTGSGKTLTSFKTAQLLAETGLVEKVLFVVDRKDLDYQTMKEYDAFEKGAANSNSSTRILNAQLSDPSKRIIITTIHKLNSLIKSETNHPAYSQRVAIIFDECHRSQFGDMHRAITKRFTKYSIFGFTGTPIFDANSTGALGATTESLFVANVCMNIL